MYSHAEEKNYLALSCKDNSLGRKSMHLCFRGKHKYLVYLMIILKSLLRPMEFATCKSQHVV